MDRFDEFRQLHRPGHPLLLPNAWDVASAALFASAGFAAIGTTSLGVAASGGKPDGTAATRAETLALAERLTELPCLLTVDLEGGFSEDPDEIGELARHLAQLGVAGVNIEDSRPDFVLRSIEQQRDVIEAVKTAAPNLFLNARIDTFWLTPRPRALAETIQRATDYAAAGADGVFVPGLSDPAGITELVAAVDVPVNILFTPSGPSLAQLAELGVARVSCGSLLFRTALTNALGVLEAVATGGAVDPKVLGYAEVQKLAGLAAAW